MRRSLTAKGVEREKGLKLADGKELQIDAIPVCKLHVVGVATIAWSRTIYIILGLLHEDRLSEAGNDIAFVSERLDICDLAVDVIVLEDISICVRVPSRSRHQCCSNAFICLSEVFSHLFGRPLLCECRT